MIQHRTGTGNLPAKGEWLQTARTLPPEARVMGVYLLGASRTGKSRLLGRVIAWQDFLAEIGLVRFLQYVPLDQHAKYWRRIRYVETSGKGGYSTGLPLYYRLTPEETLAEISERYLLLILRSSPHLADAQYFGWPPLHRFGLNAGILCASLGRQVTDIESLISHPEQWLPRFAEAEARYPEARAACDFFRNEYLPMRPVDRARLTNAFRDKLVQFSTDPLLSRQFGAKTPGIDWEEVDAEGLTVLLDFSRETNTELRRFKMLWLFDYFFSWLKTRGRRSYPLALLIDEFASMTHKEFSGENPFAVEMAEFIQEYLRNSNIWLTVTYLFARAPVPEARILADYLYKRDPYLVKHWRKVWMNGGSLRGVPLAPFVVDVEPEFMSLEDQLEDAANRIAELGLFRFLCRPALREGEVSQSVIPVTIEHVDRDEETGEYHFPNPQRIQDVCSLLAAQSGIPATTMLKALESALPVRSGDRAGHSLRQQPPQPPAPAVPADGNREDTASGQPPHRHHRSRRIS